MDTTLPIMQARDQLTTLPQKFEDQPKMGAITITRRGKPVMTLLPHDLYEAIMETLEITTDPSLMRDLQQSIRDQKAGRTVDWAQARAEILR